MAAPAATMPLHFPSSPIKGDDCTWVFGSPANVPRVSQRDRDLVVLRNVPEGTELTYLLAAFSAPVDVPTGAGVGALNLTGWWEPVAAFRRPGCRRLLSPSGGNRASSADSNRKVWSPTTCVAWVLGFVPMIVLDAQQVYMLPLACSAVGVAERSPDRQDPEQAWAWGCVNVFRGFVLPVVVPCVGIHGCSKEL